MHPNRYWCNALEDCRIALKKLNILNIFFFKKQIAMLLEELQVYGSRMEAAIDDKQDLHRFHNEASHTEKELKTLRMQKEELEVEIEGMEKTMGKVKEIDELHAQKLELMCEIFQLEIDKMNLTKDITQIDDSIMHSVFFEEEECGDG
jgi:5-bromo-4-chloroindolyl phosphate hydrolysis protein